MWEVRFGEACLALRYSFADAFRCAEEFRNRWDWNICHIVSVPKKAQ